MHVDVDEWLKKDRYDAQYREMILRALRPENMNVGPVSCDYEAFAKIEFQFTEVLHDWKSTIFNDVKERQICGPTNHKKVVANSFINAVEELAHLFNKEYCGRKNWMEICKDLDDASDEIPDIIWGASDGSGFDMTQLPQHNALMNELFEAILDLPGITLEARLSKADIRQVLRDSLYLKVSVDHGALKYQALGRASGDGWTTCGNTHLMISYWRYTFYKAEIPRNRFLLRVKGDDVLFAISRKYKDKINEWIIALFARTKDKQEYGLGQICKKVEWGPIENLDFLSCHFFYSNGRLRMTRIPPRVIQTICYSTKYRMDDKPEVMAQLCYSKGCSLRAWANGLPIFGKLADKMVALGKPGRTDWNYYADYGRIWTHKSDDYDAYVDYLESRYSITRADVVAIEAVIDRIDSLDGNCFIPQLQRFFERSKLEW